MTRRIAIRGRRRCCTWTIRYERFRKKSAGRSGGIKNRHEMDCGRRWSSGEAAGNDGAGGTSRGISAKSSRTECGIRVSADDCALGVRLFADAFWKVSFELGISTQSQRNREHREMEAK